MTKHVSVQTFHRQKGQTIRLEFDAKDHRQSVYLNGQMMSSFICPTGREATHTFKGTDSQADEDGWLGEYRIRFAVDREFFKIKYEICRRNSGGDDTKWYWYDRNMEPHQWSALNDQDKKTGNGNDSLNCDPVCSVCEDQLVCLNCEQDQFHTEAVSNYDAVKMQELLAMIDPEQLQTILIDSVSKMPKSDVYWPDLIRLVLDEAGADSEAVVLQPDGKVEADDEAD